MEEGAEKVGGRLLECALIRWRTSDLQHCSRPFPRRTTLSRRPTCTVHSSHRHTTGLLSTWTFLSSQLSGESEHYKLKIIGIELHTVNLLQILLQSSLPLIPKAKPENLFGLLSKYRLMQLRYNSYTSQCKASQILPHNHFHPNMRREIRTLDPRISE